MTERRASWSETEWRRKKIIFIRKKFLFRLPERWRGYFGSIFWQLVLKIKKGGDAGDDKV